MHLQPLASPDCFRCPTCGLGCTAASEMAPAPQRQALDAAQGRLRSDASGPIPYQCWHCAQAACVEVCPAQAMVRDESNGLVQVDRSRCIACWMCVLACPFGAVLPHREGAGVVTCDGCCGDNIPACAGVCGPRDAMLSPAGRPEGERQRRRGLAGAGWGWPGVAHYPPPRPDPVRSACPPAVASSGRYVIVGAGAATVAAVEAIRRLDSHGHLTVIAEETAAPYARVLLADYLAGRRDGPSLALRPPDWWARMGVEMIAGDGARQLRAGGRLVRLASGRRVAYDRLLIATGASPVSLSIPGADLAGVVGLRNLADAELIRAREPRQALVLGGGFIGIKAAEALHQRGVPVTIVEARSYLLPATLDVRAAELVRRWIEDRGLRVITGTRVREIVGRDRVQGAVLESGEHLRVDLAVVGVGVRPNLDWLPGSPLGSEPGMVVDAQMRTKLPGVWAAGDVTRTQDFLSGRWRACAIWPAAAAQGRVAGTVMAGGAAAYEGSLPMNTLNVLGLPVASFGQVEGEGTVTADDGPEHYVKLFFRRGVLVGAVLVGDLREAGRLLARAKRQESVR